MLFRSERAGLRAEDLILELDGRDVSDVNELQRLMVAELIGRKVPVRVFREGGERELVLIPGELR